VLLLPSPCCLNAAAAAPPGSPGPVTSYDELEDTPGTNSSHGRIGAAAAAAGLVVEPRCSDMCPAAEREQRTSDKQLHDFERVAGQEYATDAAHAVKKYTRSGERGSLVECNVYRVWGGTYAAQRQSTTDRVLPT
jgi:hypothetical protein